MRTPEDMHALLQRGKRQRKTASQKMNDESSRSHAVFTVHVECLDEGGRPRAGKLHLVDLAGSERQKKTGADGQLLKARPPAQRRQHLNCQMCSP